MEKGEIRGSGEILPLTLASEHPSVAHSASAPVLLGLQPLPSLLYDQIPLGVEMGSHVGGFSRARNCSPMATLSAALWLGFPCGSAGKESTCNAGDLGVIPGLGRAPGEGKGYPLLYSGLEKSMDCTVHGIAKTQTRLSDFHFLPYGKTKPDCWCYRTVSSSS